MCRVVCEPSWEAKNTSELISESKARNALAGMTAIVTHRTLARAPTYNSVNPLGRSRIWHLPSKDGQPCAIAPSRPLGARLRMSSLQVHHVKPQTAWQLKLLPMVLQEICRLGVRHLCAVILILLDIWTRQLVHKY